jgi:hypothetical protein
VTCLISRDFRRKDGMEAAWVSSKENLVLGKVMTKEIQCIWNVKSDVIPIIT